MEYTKETFQQELKRRFPQNDIELLDFNGTFKFLRYKCLTCGRIYEKTRANHVYENKTLCQKCYTARDSKIRNWIEHFFNTHSEFELLNKNWQTTSEKLRVKYDQYKEISDILSFVQRLSQNESNKCEAKTTEDGDDIV